MSSSTHHPSVVIAGQRTATGIDELFIDYLVLTLTIDSIRRPPVSGDLAQHHGTDPVRWRTDHVSSPPSNTKNPSVHPQHSRRDRTLDGIASNEKKKQQFTSCGKTVSPLVTSPTLGCQMGKVICTLDSGSRESVRETGI